MNNISVKNIKKEIQDIEKDKAQRLSKLSKDVFKHLFDTYDFLQEVSLYVVNEYNDNTYDDCIIDIKINENTDSIDDYDKVDLKIETYTINLSSLNMDYSKYENSNPNLAKSIQKEIEKHNEAYEEYKRHNESYTAYQKTQKEYDLIKEMIMELNPTNLIKDYNNEYIKIKREDHTNV